MHANDAEKFKAVSTLKKKKKSEMRLFCFCSSFQLVHTKIQQFKTKEMF